MDNLYKDMLKKLAGQTVLVIEKDASTIDELRSMLEPTTKMLIASSSHQCSNVTQLITETQPNLIMINLDFEGAGTTGIELSSAIKQLEAFQLIPHVPVIIYANLDGDDTQERFFMSSADMLIIQPINEKNFIENISKHTFYRHIMQA